MTPFDRVIMFDAPGFRAIVHIDDNEVIVKEWQSKLRVFMSSKLTLTKLREWFVEYHPDFTETDVTGC